MDLEDGKSETIQEPHIKCWQSVKCGTDIWYDRTPKELINLLNNGQLRTPYLTRVQIEAEGWEMYSKGIDMWFEKEVLTVEFDWSGLCNLYGYKPYKLFLNYGEHDHKINIKCDFSGGADFSKSDTLFEGYCPSINEFRYISKLLKIK